MAIALVAVAGSGALLAAGAWWLLTSPRFAVARVESGPYRFTTQADLDLALRSALGHNIWTLGTADLAAACARLPWVRAVHLRRRVPDTVTVELEEWRPLVGVASARSADLEVLIGDGRVLPWPAHLQPPGLPVLVGAALDRSDPAAPRLDAGTVVPVMAVLDALVATGFEAAYPVDFIRLTDRGVVLELERRGGSLVLGDEEFAPRLRRYLLARDRIPSGAHVDLRFQDRITFETPQSAGH
ncbi:MAG: FtsQ-type POTRA domain-containing protein [Candidatus Krumholzibacteriia bacterium]